MDAKKQSEAELSCKLLHINILQQKQWGANFNENESKRKFHEHCVKIYSVQTKL
jgi:hypothetical protein